MRVLVAPDEFAGTLTAPQAAAAIAEGWRRQAPDAEVDLAPVADGGPGFVGVLHAALGGELVAATVDGPFGEPVPAAWLLAGDTAYVESAEACGLALARDGRAEDASSRGVGELVAAAVAAGARRVVVGVGGTATTDGGAGLLAALGAHADRPLDQGPAALAGLGAVDLSAARARTADVELVVAADVTAPLTGLFGTVRASGVERGIAEERVVVVDAVLEAWARVAGRRAALEPGAGAGGGIGYALGLLGGRTTSGVDLVLEAVDLPARARRADVVVTGEGRFDHTSRTGKAPHGVARVAEAALRPCVVVAGEVLVGAREMRALGVEAAYAVVDDVGAHGALDRAYDALVVTAARVARTWAR
ncbi:glycerate kinase [Nocardioides zeae]|uniref:Glycerate kinase n=1 Tax=Nocardioides imazamoxiresistens TaxID=3231893 RepID=A0ABU3PYG1_9ACTN|nr:glycerate kinase [Nocardioides zeae]MDT9593820.1 glycerate kinase [Nocardioides zeae]